MIPLHPNTHHLIPTRNPILLRGRFYGTIRQVRAGVVLCSNSHQDVFSYDEAGVTVIVSGPEAEECEATRRVYERAKEEREQRESSFPLLPVVGPEGYAAMMGISLKRAHEFFDGFPKTNMVIPEPKPRLPNAAEQSCYSDALGLWCEREAGHEGNHRKDGVEWL